RAAEEASSERLGSRTDVRVLKLEQMSGKDARRVISLAGKLTGLRRLTIQGGDGATEGDIARLSGLKVLRRLALEWCNGVTDAGLRKLAALKGLKSLELS